MLYNFEEGVYIAMAVIIPCLTYCLHLEHHDIQLCAGKLRQKFGTTPSSFVKQHPLPSAASSRRQESQTLAPPLPPPSPLARSLVISRGRRQLSRSPLMKGAARPYASWDLARSSQREDAVLGLEGRRRPPVGDMPKRQ
jgi:hypothetical protein